MAQVYVTSTVPPYDPARSSAYGDTERFLRAVASDAYREHHLAQHPDQADIILFIGSQRPDMADIKHAPLARRHREKTFVFHMGDKIVPHLPGVYTCLERQWHQKSRTRAGHYTQVGEYEACIPSRRAQDATHLYTFLGRCATHPVRRQLLEISDPRGSILATDGGSDEAGPRSPRAYYDHLESGLFGLCPRGLGSSSFRLFECMRMGRAPVVISDSWVPPEGPKWDEFSLRVPEAQVPQLPGYLREMSPRAVDMGERALSAYKAWFSKEATFHRVVNWCLSIRSSRRLPEAVLSLGVQFRMLAPRRLVERVLRPKAPRPG